MKVKVTTFIVPMLYALVLTVFLLIVRLVISADSEGYSEIYGIIYSLSFFIANPVYSYVLGSLLILPLLLLIWAIIKKRKDLIAGFSISTFISVVIILLAVIA